MSNELVVIEEATALQVFSTDNGLDPIIQQAREAVDGFDHDLSTAAGRKRTASLANKVAKLKTRLDGMGKDLVSDWKTKAKAVDENRKAMRDELDQLKAVARKPLTEWEDEQERIKADELARIEAEKVAAEIYQAHEVALLINEKFDRELEDKLAEEARLEEERQRIEAERKKAHEKELVRVAAENARIEAERAAAEAKEKIEQERLAAIKREQDAILKAEQAERDLLAAEQRAEQQRIDSENNARLAAEQAEKKRLADIESSRLAEIKRQQEEETARIEQQSKLEANRKHAAKVHNSMNDAFIAAGLDADSAVKAVKALVNKSIPNIGNVQY